MKKKFISTRSKFILTKNIITGFLLVVINIFLAECVNAQRSWIFNFSLGDSYCFRTPLTIEQEGYDKLNIQASYYTDSFSFPVYYSWKIGTSKGNRAFEIELTHLKIYLENKPPEVQHFAVSHGYNYFTLNYSRDIGFIIIRAGAGVIISHPENIVRNMELDTHNGLFNRGYYFSGPGLQVAAEKRFRIYKGLFLSLEVKAAGAVAKVPIVNGNAIVPQAGLHGLFGLGYRFE